jgi:hypothetical protein
MSQCSSRSKEQAAAAAATIRGLSNSLEEQLSASRAADFVWLLTAPRHEKCLHVGALGAKQPLAKHLLGVFVKLFEKELCALAQAFACFDVSAQVLQGPLPVQEPVLEVFFACPGHMPPVKAPQWLDKGCEL